MRRWMIASFILVHFLAACQDAAIVGKADETNRDNDSDISTDEARIDKVSADIAESLGAELKKFLVIDDADSGAVDKYSRRGDLRMFLGEFQAAVDDYRKMVTLQPDLDASHWRLGIALYFADHPEEAAAQFDKYHSFDNVDRENGIWRYLSHRLAFGREKAREQLLKYEKDDRPPFKEVYQLFDGTLTADEVLKSISADLPENARNSRMFYAHLYVGLNNAAENRTQQAIESLKTATLNPWPRQAGFGPDYMWHVGRLQYQRLKAKVDKESSTDKPE